jgi:hypothetical protein
MVTTARRPRTVVVRACLASILLAGLAASCRAGSPSLPEARADESAPAFAVVELFTSEGCSSCPPADGVLADLVQSADPRIYALAFHVDYWDSLGWPDRFASRANTSRQDAYERALGLEGLYTPQMIVGGTEQFTGSDRAHAGAAIARALSHGGALRLALRARVPMGDAVTIDYEVPGVPAGSVLAVAVVERSRSTSVRAGENAGKTLRHANVVRGFATAPLDAPTGSVVVHTPEALSRGDGPNAGEVIAYVQRSSAGVAGMPVLAAARAALPSP